MTLRPYNARHFGPYGRDPVNAEHLGGIPLQRIAAIFEAERESYVAAHPRSLALAGHGIAGFYQGVPMHWMRDWSMPYPFLVESAHGAVLRDVDGNEYADFCLGDTGSMFGHSPPAVVEAITRQAGRGLTYMLPTEDAIEVGRLLAERFGLPHWQIATTATDANRFALRVARAVTGRPKILVFNGCYHGTVDDTFVRLVDGRTVNRPGLLGQVARPHAARARGRVQRPRGARGGTGPRRRGRRHHRTGHDQLVHGAARARASTRHCARLTRASTARCSSSTRRTRISTGPGGYTRAIGLEPDLFVVGKSVAGGMPGERLGLHRGRRAAARRRPRADRRPGHSGMGTTLSANALRSPAMRATLERGDDGPKPTPTWKRSPRASPAGLQRSSTTYGVPWHVVRVGARVEFICAPGPLRNGTQAEAAHAPALEQAIHLASAQPRLPDRTVPQHDAGVAGHDGRPGRNARPGVRVGGRQPGAGPRELADETCCRLWWRSWAPTAC